MSGGNYEALVSQLQEEALTLQKQAEEIRLLKATVRQAEESAAKRAVQNRAIQVFATGALGMAQENQVYQLLCQTLVHELKWDAALVVQASPQVEVRASFHLTKRQERMLEERLDHLPVFLKAYAHHALMNTIGRADAPALALRSLLQTDEVSAVPLMFGDHLFGYVIVCAHTVRNQRRTPDDQHFLQVISGLAAQAVEMTHSFNELESQNNRLRQLEEIKDSFISITSHQLRTPLSVVKWTLSLLEDDPNIQKLDEQYKMVQQAYGANERLIRVVNDLLNVSRIQDGKLPFAPQLADVREYVRELTDGMERLCKSREITLKVSLTDVPLLDVDPVLFKEAIQNMLDNALDYNEKGGEIEVILSKEKGAVVIRVRNTGPGIAPADLPAVFDQFFRAAEAPRFNPNGNGLGLYLTRAIVRQHGGEVSVESTFGKDAVFTIAVPYRER